MKTLSNNLTAKKNALATDDPWLVLIEVTLPDASKFYLVNNNEDITFDGQVYTKANFSLDPPKTTSTGEIPTVKLSVCNINQALDAILEEHSGGVGSIVKLVVVNAGLLSENYAELEMSFDVLATSVNSMSVTFNLGAPNPLISRFPQYRYIAGRCKWLPHYAETGSECGYSGELPSCLGTLDDCKAHNNARRYGGYPGIVAGGVRIA